MISLRRSPQQLNRLNRRAADRTGFDPEEIRRIVQLGKERGLIRDGQTGIAIAKDGVEATKLGAVQSQWITVTPARAQEWLQNNFRNRPLVEDLVVAYARDMTNGEWVATHQGIAFNDKDELIDGQHRLHAIVRSGALIRMMVTFGLPAQIEGKEMTTMDAVDRGRARSVADQLKIQHALKDGTAIAMICIRLAALCSNERTRRLSVGQTLEIFRAFENPVRWVIAHRSREVGLRQAGVLAGFAFAIASEGEYVDGATFRAGPVLGSVGAIFAAVVSGEGLKPGAAALLREFLCSDDAKLLSRGTDRAIAELTLQAIYLELNQTRVAKLELCTDGANHFRALQPERVAKIAAIFQMGGAR